MVFLESTSSEAQQGGGSTGGSTNAALACSNGERQVDSFTGSGSLTTDPFTISAPQWRYLYQATSASDAGNISIEAIDQGGNSVPFSASNLALLPSAEESSIDIDGPGTFNLEIVADRDVSYSIIVCQRATPAAQPNQSTTPVPTTPQQQQKNNVVPGSVPNRRLAPTGGLPASYVVYGFVLAGASLLALALVRRGR